MGNRVTALKNLKKRGAEANPNGRPKKGYSITETFQEMFNAKPEIKQELAESILKHAKKGDAAAVKLIWNYMDGMPVQESKDKLEVTVLKGLVDVE